MRQSCSNCRGVHVRCDGQHAKAEGLAARACSRCARNALPCRFYRADKPGSKPGQPRVQHRIAKVGKQRRRLEAVITSAAPPPICLPPTAPAQPPLLLVNTFLKDTLYEPAVDIDNAKLDALIASCLGTNDFARELFLACGIAAEQALCY